MENQMHQGLYPFIELTFFVRKKFPEINISFDLSAVAVKGSVPSVGRPFEFIGTPPHLSILTCKLLTVSFRAGIAGPQP